MIFNSIEFFLFLAVVYLLYLPSGLRLQNTLLLAASYLFYGWWDPRFLFLITLSTCVDFICGQLINRPTRSLSLYIRPVIFLFASAILFLGFFASDETIAADGKFNNQQILGLGLIVSCLFTVFAFGARFYALKISTEVRRKLFVTLSVTINLGILGLFKYFNFFIESAESMMLSAGFSESSLVHLDIILPVGISFYTFQTMSYCLDIYRRNLKPTNHFLDFALFVSYFPQLVAGPIERAKNLLPAIMRPRKVGWADIYTGLGLISYGMFKKVVIADGLASSVTSIYGTTGAVSWLDIVLATLFFTVQIYCDFSGYSDIARGTSRLLGINLMINFKLPYFSRSPSEFWERWHISLSSWLRDYLYISLGGNRKGKILTYRNLMLTMVLGGLWHGAAWNFALWGVYQGLILCIYRFVDFNIGFLNRQLTGLAGNVKTTLAWALFFVLTCYGWLLFRAESFEQIASFSMILLTDWGNTALSIKIPTFATLMGLPILVLFELWSYFRPKFSVLQNEWLFLRSAVYGLMLFIFFGALSNEPAQFIYFQF